MNVANAKDGMLTAAKYRVGSLNWKATLFEELEGDEFYPVNSRRQRTSEQGLGKETQSCRMQWKDLFI
jgi:hypothetical protein